MKKRYANARDVLPPKLLRQVQRYWGGLLWVPLVDRRKLKRFADRERDRRIVREHRRGESTAALARRYCLSQERIRQIARAAKRS